MREEQRSDDKPEASSSLGANPETMEIMLVWKGMYMTGKVAATEPASAQQKEAVRVLKNMIRAIGL